MFTVVSLAVKKFLYYQRKIALTKSKDVYEQTYKI